MNQTTAKVISYTLQPLAMPLLSVFLAFSVDPYMASYYNQEAKLAIYSVMGLNTFIVPTLLVIYLKRLKIISSLDVENRKERLIPFVLTLALYITTYILLKKSSLPQELYSIVLGSIIAMIAAFLITFFWKISIHMTGIGGVIGVMCALFQVHFFFPVGILTILILVAGFIGTARMVLNVHTIAQVICGTILGFTTQFLVVKYAVLIWKQT